MGCGNGRDQRTHSEVRARRYLSQMRPYTEEPGAEQFACPVLDWRRRGRPLRRPYGKMRKLGIPCVRDKVVQEVMHLILEAIYDSPNAPYFQETSHGFRPQRSCHTALREVRTHWTGVNWYIEGDIRACFDELDHQVLVHILRKKIQDERFLNLIRKLLKAGYMDLHGSKKESLIGSPQGGIISPILANVYLHELDESLEEGRKTHETGVRK